VNDPTAYMPFYFNDFLGAVRAHPDAVAVAYLEALGHNWTVLKCRGLPNNSETLRKICKRDPDEWPEIETVVFDCDKFFSLGEDNLWHQNRQDLEWAKSKEKYEATIKRTSAGGRARSKALTSRQRSEIARKGAEARWNND
jgi:uncharacterized protein YdaU (DUF1376 family)